jgi:vacuolar-type H+-ATPase subunit I/STV1
MTMSKIVNLTPQILRRIISEEKKKILKSRKAAPSGKVEDLKKVAKQTREVEAKDMAHTLAKEVQHYKDLQKEHAELARRLSEINEARQELRAHILEQL